MVKIKRWIILFFILSLPLVSAVQTVEVAPPPVKKAGIGDAIGSVLSSPLFWGGFLLIIVLIVFVILIVYIVKWIIKFIKRQKDIFYLMKTKRIRLAKIHRHYPAKHWWHISKNTPIRLARKDDNGKVTFSRPIAWHRGDYTSHEGNVNIALNMEGKNKYWIFPDTDLLVIPNKDHVTITQRDEKGNKTSQVSLQLPLAKDILQFNEGEIIIFAESLSYVDEFLIPVLKTKDGKIVDLSMPIFSTLKDVVIGDYLYTQTSDFGVLAKQAMNINPNVRGIIKTSDSNQSVEIPSQS